MFKICFEISLIRCIEILIKSGYEIDFNDFESRFEYFKRYTRWIKLRIETRNTAVYNDIAVTDYGFYDIFSDREIIDIEECAYDLAELYAGEKIERLENMDSSLKQYRYGEELIKSSESDDI